MYFHTIRLVPSVTVCNFYKMATKPEIEVTCQRYNLGERFQRRLWGFVGRALHFRCTRPRPMLGNTGNGEMTCQTGSRNNLVMVQLRRVVPTVNMGFSGSDFPCLLYCTSCLEISEMQKSLAKPEVEITLLWYNIGE
jgi:hypothetical protein